MDSVTQASLGAAAGYLCWHKELGRKALITGAVLGTLPDLDILLYPLMDQVERLYWHRGESHSIFFILFGTIATTLLMRRLDSLNILSLRKAAVGTLVIYVTHILIDLCTIYGTQLLAPVSRTGYGFGNFFIIDPLFTLVLLLGIAGAAIFKPKTGHRCNSAGLLLASLYMLWSFSIQAFADAKFQKSAKTLNASITRQLTTAAPFTTFLWRHMVETDDGFFLAYWSVFDTPDRTIKFQFIPKQQHIVEPIVNSRTFRAVAWFSKGWWCVIESDGHFAKVVDMRFSEIPSVNHTSYLFWNWPFGWSFELDKESVKDLQAVVPDVQEPVKIIGMLVNRIRGEDGWLIPTGNERIGVINTTKGLSQ